MRTLRYMKSSVLSPLLMVAGIALTNPALAADGKEYPGTMCNEGVDGYHQTRASGDVVFSVRGDALNISTTSTRYTTCPLVRDADRYQGNITYAAVNVYKPTNVGVGCTLYSNPYFGGSGWFNTKWDFSSSTGLRLIEIPVKADTYTSGSFNISCIHPKTVSGKKSGIYHYGIVETD